jgi:hypothetical protein
MALILSFLATVQATGKAGSEVQFTLFQRFLDDRMFQITNRSANVIELDGMFPFDSGYPFEPAYARLEGYARRRRVETHTLGGQDVPVHLYPLRPGETIYFRLSFEDGYYLKNCTFAKIRLGKYLSESFPVRKLSATDIDFRQYGTDGEDVLFRIQNNGETAIQLPSMELKDNADAPFEVAAFEVQRQQGTKWIQVTKADFAAKSPYWITMEAKETLIFKIPKASFDESPKGGILRIKVGDYFTKPFRLH